MLQTLCSIIYMRMSQSEAYRLSTLGRGLDGMALMNDFFFISKILLDPSIRFSIKSWPWNDILHDSSSALAELPGLYYVSRHVPRN